MVFSLRLSQLTIGMAAPAQHRALLEMIRTARFRIVHFGLQTLALPVETYQISAAWHNDRPVAALVATPAAGGALWIRACGLDGISVSDHPDVIGLLASTLVHQAVCSDLWYSADSHDPWLSEILHHNGFVPHGTIIGMEQVKAPDAADIPPVALLRPLLQTEHALVHAIDAQAFAPQWQKAPHDLNELHRGDSHALLATVDDQPVGYALATWHDHGQICHLVRIAVLPALQGRGIAQQLLAAVLAHAHTHHAARITLNTQSDNLAARALYTRMGFLPNGESYQVSRALSLARYHSTTAAS